VFPGERVQPGDTVGFVGNTGNARTTPPHLHFGVYRRGEGPVDPYWFVFQPRGQLPRLAADTLLLGDWVRTPGDNTLLRSAPDAESRPVLPLPRHTLVRVLTAVGAWYRVRLPDGQTGYVTARLTEPASRAVRVAAFPIPAPILTRPLAAPEPSDVIAETLPGESVDVLGRFGTYLLVRAPGGAAGWMAEQ
jgi:hypothetical protein